MQAVASKKVGVSSSLQTLNHDFRHMAFVVEFVIIASVSSKLPGSQSHDRVLRAIGWAFLGLPILDSATRRGYTLSYSEWLTWLGFFLLFGPAFWYSSDTKPRPKAMRVIALSVETLAVVVMTFLLQDYFVGFLLVIVSWQVALLLPLRLAIPWSGSFRVATLLS
jgi:hypothetical protein